MNNSVRGLHDDELERLCEKMSGLDPTSEDYSKIFHSYEIMAKIANEDDKNYSEAQNVKAKIEADADRLAMEEKLETAKLAMEEKLETEKRAAEAKAQRKALRNGLIVTSITVGGSALGYILTNHVNLSMLKYVLAFERDGYAITTQALKQVQKIPILKH